MRTLAVALLTPLLAIGAASAQGAGRIDEVTVYLDRAEIVRELTVQLKAGANAVVFDEIPIAADADSFRVSGSGVAAQLGAVEIAFKAETPVETAEYKAAERALRELEREMADLAAQSATDADLKQFLKELRAATAKNESEKLAEGHPDAGAIGAFYDLLASKMTALAQAKLDRDEQAIDLARSIEVAREHLATLAPRKDIRTRVATIEVEAQRAGALTLRLAYVVRGASWSPSYRATLDADSGEVHLVVEGVVRQSSGSDWSDVALKVSTASPATGVEPPFLPPWTLRPIEYEPMANAGFAEQDVAKERFHQNVTALAPGVADGDGALRNQSVAAPPAAPLISSGYNVTFAVPGRSTVVGDGRDHRVTLRTETLPGKIVHRIVPGLNAAAFLTSVTTAPKDYPLLAGSARVFVDGAFLGSFKLEEKGPGVEVTMPFGPDNRLEVIRVPVPRSLGREGFGKLRSAEFEYRTKLHNLLPRAVTVVLEERLPVAEDERIEVELDKATTPGFEDSPRRPGVKLWTFEMAAGEKREIVFAYTVRYPREMRLAGID